MKTVNVKLQKFFTFLLFAALVLSWGTPGFASDDKSYLFSLNIEAGEDQSLLKKCTEALKKNPDDVRHLVDAGWISLLYSGDSDGAAKYFEKAVSLKKDAYWAHYGLAKYYEQRGNAEKEFSHWDRIMCLEPDSLRTEMLAAFMAMQRVDLLRRMKFVDIKYKNPITRGYVDQVKLALAGANADFEEIKRLKASSGMINDWLVIGGFGKVDSAAFHSVFPPERAIDRHAEYDGTRTRVRWYRQQDYLPVNYMDYCDFGRFCNYGIKYALTYIHAGDKARPGVIWYYNPDETKIWLNNEKVYQSDMKHKVKRRRAVIKVRLSPGWNKLLIKTESSFRLAITDLEGGLIPGLRTKTDFQHKEWQTIEKDIKASDMEIPDVPVSTAEKLQQLLDKNTKNIIVRLELAEMSYLRGLGEDAVFHAKEVVHATPKFAVNRVFLARTYLNDPTKNPVDQQDSARKELEQARKLDKKCVDAYLDLAHMFKQRNTDKAVALLKKLIATIPGKAKAHLMLGQIFADRNWFVEAEREFMRARELAPDWEEPLATLERFWRGYSSSFGGVEEFKLKLADEAEEKLIQMNKGNESRVIGKWRRMGEYDKIRKYCEKMRKILPYSEYWINTLSGVAEEHKRYEEVLGYYDELEKLNPASKLDFLKRRASVLLLMGKKKEAADLLEEWLNHPDNIAGDADTTKFLNELKGKGNDYYKKYEPDLKPILTKAAELGRDKYPDAHSLMVYEQTVHKIIDEKGNGEAIVHRIVKVLTEEGRVQQGNPELGEQIREIRVIMPDGKIVEPDFVGGSIHLEELKEDCVIDSSYKIRKDLPRNQLGNKFSLNIDFSPSEEYPILQRRYVLIVPRKLADKLEKLQPNFETNPEIKEDGENIIYIWEQKDLKRFMPEPSMVPQSEFMPYVLWGEPVPPELVAKALAIRVDRMFLRTKFLERKALELTKDRKTLLEKVRTIYNFVMEDIRGDGRGFGGDPTLTLANRSGGRFSLAAALMEAAGIDIEIIRVRPKPVHKIIPGFNEWEGFFYMLLGVVDEKGDRHYLDFSIRYMPFGRMPDFLLGCEAIIVNKNAISFTTIPVLSIEKRGAYSRFAVAIQPSGDITYKYNSTMYAEGGAAWREALKSVDPNRIKMYIEQNANTMMRGTSISDLVLPDHKLWDAPAELSFNGESAGFAEKILDGISFDGVLERLELARTLIGKTERKYDQVVRGIRISKLMLTPAVTGRYRAEFTIPKGFVVSTLPKSVAIINEFGTFNLIYRIDDGKIIVDRTVVLPIQRVPAKEYANFISFCQKIDEAEKARILITQKK